MAGTGLNFEGKQEMGEHVNLFSRMTKGKPCSNSFPRDTADGAGGGTDKAFLKILSPQHCSSSILCLQSQRSRIPVVNMTRYFFTMKHCGLSCFPCLLNV